MCVHGTRRTSVGKRGGEEEGGLGKAINRFGVLFVCLLFFVVVTFLIQLGQGISLQGFWQSHFSPSSAPKWLL